MEDTKTSLPMKPLEFYKPTLVCLAFYEGRNNIINSFSTQFFTYLIIALFERILLLSLIYQIIANC